MNMKQDVLFTDFKQRLRDLKRAAGTYKDPAINKFGKFAVNEAKKILNDTTYQPSYDFEKIKKEYFGEEMIPYRLQALMREILYMLTKLAALRK